VRHAAILFGLLVAACSPAAAPAGAEAPSASADPAEPSIVVTDAMGSPHLGDAAPDFDLPDQDGKHLRLADLRGQVVVLAFVASFCPFSRAEQPHLRKLAEEYGAMGKGIRVVAIGIDEPEPAYRSYIARMPMGMPILRDEGGAVALKFTPPGAQPEFKDRKMALVTSNLVLDRTGKIRFFTVVDTVHFDARLVHVRKAVDELLREKGSEG
jgi:peroxiredoxin